jgi:hypothetical protein
MRKTTAPRNASRQKAQCAEEESGLIAKTLKSQQSAGTKSALDNRSHRTPEFSCSQIKASAASNPQIGCPLQRSLRM